MNEDFLKSIHYDDFPKDAMMFFDEIMVLYNIIGHKNGMDITKVNDSSAIKFNIFFDITVECERTYEMLNGTDFSVYGKKYIVNMMRVDDNNLEVILLGG